MTRLVTLVLVFLCSIAARTSFAWDGSPSPFDSGHLVVVRPENWRVATGPLRQVSLSVANNNAAAGRAAPVATALSSPLEIKHAGRYDLWVRVGRRGKAVALNAEVVRNGKPVFSGVLNNDEGDAARGGPAGYAAYSERAGNTVSGDAATNFDLLDAGNGDIKNGILQDMADEAEGGVGRWINSFRVEKINTNAPFYWWKIAGVALEPGNYELKIRPTAAVDAAAAPFVDVALLTTSTDLVYSFIGDIDAPTANYVRFRIDSLGKQKQVPISLSFSVHRNPFYTTANANPDGFPKNEKSVPHTKTGFTRWYRMGDVKYVPWGGFTLSIGVPDDALGASQFARFPHDDTVDHEFDWHEVDGRVLAVGSPAIGDIYTGRDMTRLHYEYALAATNGRVYPLMRGDALTLTNAWGLSRGGASEYMAKTLRLLGFNQVDMEDAAKNSERYGWLSGDKAPYVQLADEPVEANTLEFSAPVWRFEGGKSETKTVPAAAPDGGKVRLDAVAAKPVAAKTENTGERYRDVTGSSDLNTARVDLEDCVLEGEVSGTWVGFRAGLDNAQLPTKGVFWMIGKLDPNGETNVSYGRIGDARGSSLVRKAAVMNTDKPTPFKIIYERGKAALLVNGAVMQQFDGLALKGGLGIFGPQKTIYSLRLRSIRADEHIDVDASKFLTDKMDAAGVGGDTLLDARDFEDTPDETEKTAMSLRQFVTTQMVAAGGIPEAQVSFRTWLASEGVTPAVFGKKTWNEVSMLTLESLIETPEDRRRYYWSRRYSAYKTPHEFYLAALELQKNSANKNAKGFVALSGHALYMHRQALPMDIMTLASEGGPLMPGVSDWMYVGGWYWDSLQSVAYSVAPMNGGARRYGTEWGQEPRSYPMMHQVGPDVFRSYTMLSNQVKHISYWTYGPSYAATEGTWSDNPYNHIAAHYVTNRIAQVDDILPKARMRPTRVAMLFSRSNEYWDPTSSYADKRAAFLGLSHEYFQPEIVTEEQVTQGALEHYDALYILDTAVKTQAHQKISDWVRGGGLLWACSKAATLNEFGEPLDLMASLAGLQRTFSTTPRVYKPTAAQIEQFPGEKPDDLLTPAESEKAIRAHSVFGRGALTAVKWEGATMRARYSDGQLGFGEKAVGKGLVVYLGHRPGFTYTRNALHGGFQSIFPDIPRAVLVAPLLEKKVEREVVLSDPTIMTHPMTTADGTVLLVYNMRPVASTNLVISLKEATKPASVQGFAPGAMTLSDMPFEYRDGRVIITLPTLESHGVGTIIRVRHTPPPADNRPQALKAHTVAQLQSTEARTISAGLWFAGLNPAWELGDKVEPFLTHDAWEVRMAAAEALWRLDRKPAAARILALYSQEKDPHVRSEMLFALAKLGHADAPKLCLQALAGTRDYVRRQAMRAVVVLVQDASKGGAAPSAAQQTLAASAAELAAKNNMPNDSWGIGPGWKEQLLPLMPAKDVVDAAVAISQNPSATDVTSPWGNDTGAFVSAIAKSDALFAEYSRRNLPGDQGMVLAIAARRRSPILVKAMQEMLPKVEAANVWPFLGALDYQRDKALTKQVFLARKTLRADIVPNLPPVMERTFGANIGANAAEWEAWFKAHQN